MAPVIQCDNVVKLFGARRAVDGISFAIAPGEVVGLVGPNGAGKTTTLRLLAGYLAADSGRIEVAGGTLPDEARRVAARIGYLPESVPLYPDMRVAAYLRYRAQLKSIARRERARRVADALQLAGAAACRDAVIGALSKGWRQRVGLADALLGEPEVLLLDEPTSGLDPLQVRELALVLKQLRAGRALLVSSHQLTAIEALATRVVAIVRGRVVADASPAELAGEGSLEDAFVALVGRSEP
jgi:ABC-2 type transport system ATP-binding protein